MIRKSVTVREPAELEFIKKLPRATHSGDLRIGNAVIKCFVLESVDGQEPKRLLSGRAVTQAFGLTGRGQGMNRFLEASRLRSKMSERLVQAIQEPISFVAKSTGIVPALGYEAWILPELCFAVQDANDEKPLPAHQQKLVIQAKILQRGFAIVGIDALIDEATGFQYVRDRLALQKILQKYISKEMQPYIKMFPDEFYERMWNLLGWQWKGMSAPKPMRVGQLTDDWVYKRLAPGVRDALRELVPRDEKGNLKHKLHQHLTPEEGREALAKHLFAVIAMMRGSSNLKTFQRMLDRSFPRFNETIPMDMHYQHEDEEDEEAND